MPKKFWQGRGGNFVLAAIVMGLCLIGLEFAFRLLPFTDTMGWSRTLSTAERTKRFDSAAPKKIVALGDSFTEWRTGDGVNMFDLLQKDFADQGCRILNLGHSGTDVIGYADSYRRYVTFQPDAVVMGLYLGNDVYDYKDTTHIKGVDQQYLEDTRLGVKWFIKRHSTVINFLFRLGKQHFTFMQAGSFDKTLKGLQGRRSDAEIQSRMAQIDPKMIELARSDSVNCWLVALGIADPTFYKDLFLESSQPGRMAAEATIRVIQAFHDELKGRNFLVVLIPVSLQVSEEYDDFFKRCGYDLENFPLYERRGLTRYFQRRLGESGIMTLDPTPVLEKAYPAYIPLDEHLNTRGHKAVAEAMAQFVKTHFTWR
jgi:hypothetical protein